MNRRAELPTVHRSVFGRQPACGLPTLADTDKSGPAARFGPRRHLAPDIIWAPDIT